MKKRLFVLVIILFFSIVSINFVFAAGGDEAINFIYPSNVVVGEEFNVSLVLFNFSEDVYDVKVDIKNESNYIVARFWDDSWKENSWIKNPSPIDTSQKNNETFRLNITENYEGINNITVKIKRSSVTSSDFEFTYLINISLGSSREEESNDSSPNDSSNSSASISYEIDWDKEDIVNGKEFKIKVKFFNLEDRNYDVKLWIENDSNDIMSERYDKENSEWSSGIYYIKNLSKGPGNKTYRIKIRIDENYQKFSGKADLFFRIRDMKKIEGEIVVLEKEKIIENNTASNNESEEISVTGNVIRLGKIEVVESESIKTKNYIVYESKTKKIKEYSVYGFALLCVVLCVLVIWGKME